MKKTGLFMMLLFLLANVQISKGETREYSVGKFDKINVSSIVSVVFTQGPATGTVTVTAPGSSMERVSVKVSNGELSLSYSSDDKYTKGNNGPIVATVQSPSLGSIKTSGVSSFKTDGALNLTNNLTLNISGASSLIIPKLTASEILVKQSGASQLRFPDVQGGKVTFDISGAGNTVLGTVDSPELSFNVSGAANVTMKSQKGKQMGAVVQGAAFLTVDSAAGKVLNLTVSGAAQLKVGSIDAEFANLNASGEGYMKVWGKAVNWNRNVSGGAKIKTNVGDYDRKKESKSNSIGSSLPKLKASSSFPNSGSKKSTRTKKASPTQAP